jgi:threonine aldolase
MPLIVAIETVEGNRGRITADQVLESLNPSDIQSENKSCKFREYGKPRGGGSCYEFSDIQDIKEFVCKIFSALDGARLWNALTAKDETPKQYGELFDSISICLSKGWVLLSEVSFLEMQR